MKTGKILLAIFVLFSFTKEGLAAYKQTGGIGFSIFIILIALTLSGLLLRSAFKPRDRIVQDNKHKSLLWNFLKVFSVLGILGTLISTMSTLPYSKYSVEIDGLKISLDKCVNSELAKGADLEERRRICSCLANKMATNKNILLKYRHQLQVGEFELILNDLKEKDKLDEIAAFDCYHPNETKDWNETLKTSIKQQLLRDVIKSEIEIKNIDKYCDCLVEKIVKFPVEEVLSGEFFESTDWTFIIYDCRQKDNN